MNICLICLRTDRRIKVSTGLSEFHDELCGFTLLIANTSYCSECEFLLMKFYKFKRKCMKAAQIYRNWMSGDINVPIHSLHKLLSPSSLGLWKPNPKTVCNISLKARDMEPETSIETNVNSNCYTTLQELLKHAYIEQEVKVEYDPNNENKDSIDQQNDVSENLLKSDSIHDQKINDMGTKEPLKEEVNLPDNDLECEEYLDDDMIGNVTEVHKKSDNSKKTLVKTKKKIMTAGEVLLIDRLVDELMEKLSSFGDIVTDDGVAIDKALIRKLMQHDAGEPVTRSLWSAKRRKDVLNLTPEILEALAIINTDKRKDNQHEVPDYKSVFDMEYLTTPEMKLEEFERRKTYECYVKAEHKCEICYQAFKNLKHLEYHTKKLHIERPGSVLCPICKTWNNTKSSHRLKHAVVYKCKLCPLVTYRINSMQNHFEQHLGQQYYCEQCKITYKSKSTFLAHVGRKHRQGKNVCDRCGRGFFSPIGLRIHKKNSSRCTQYAPTGTEYAPTGTGNTEPAGGVRCDECDVTLLSQAVYEAHINDVHKQGRVSEKNSAGLPKPTRFSSQSKRSNVKYTPAKHTCRVCGIVGKNFSWLQLHFKREHPDENFDVLYADKKKHLCDICGTGFSTVYTLRDHMNIHTGVRPYPCDLCPKRFLSSVKLRDHRLRHFPPAVPCTYCGKKFKTKSNLYCHMKFHTGERDYKCEICGKGFLLSSTLTEHIRGVHHNIRRVKNKNIETEVGVKRAKKRKVAEIEAIETSEVAETEEMEIKTKTIEVFDTDRETIQIGQVTDRETIERGQITDTKTIDTYEVADTETIGSCEVSETETIGTRKIAKTKIIKITEDTESRNKKKKPSKVVILRGRL